MPIPRPGLSSRTGPLLAAAATAAMLSFSTAGIAVADTPAIAAETPACDRLLAAQEKETAAKKAYDDFATKVPEAEANLARIKAAGGSTAEVAAADQELREVLAKRSKLYDSKQAAEAESRAAGTAQAGQGPCPNPGEKEPSPTAPAEKTCADFTSQEAAQTALKKDASLAATLDKNGDGRACDEKWPVNGPGNPNGPTKPAPAGPVTTIINAGTTINVYATNIYVYGGGRWVVYSDGTAVRCGSDGADVMDVDDMDGAVDDGSPSTQDVEDASYPTGGVAAGDGNGGFGMVLPMVAGLGVLGAAGGAVGMHRQRRSRVRA